MSDKTRSRPGRPLADVPGEEPTPRALLVLVWSLDEPMRVGEALVPPYRGTAAFGRGTTAPPGGEPRLHLVRARPHATSQAAPLASPGVSRVAMLVEKDGERVAVRRAGQAPLRVNRKVVDAASVGPGDLVELVGELSFLCVERPVAAQGTDDTPFVFGGPDPFGLVGESQGAWQLRDEIAFYAARDGHVLLTGPSGAGKELAARALHGLSSRRAGKLVARNAATLPPGIVDAEIFGNAKNFPNPGMRERGGLVGEADGGTLFLDEIGELPESLQAHLLRLMDDGEYHRLGEDAARRADLRVVGATHRGEDGLKHDLAARFKLRLSVPGLGERREDVPLLARTMLKALAARDQELGARFFQGGEARLEQDLAGALVLHRYVTHARELESLLLLSMATSKAGALKLTPKVEERIVLPQAGGPTKDEVVLALSRVGGNVSRAYKELGLSSRDALNRLIRKWGIDVDGLR